MTLEYSNPKSISELQLVFNTALEYDNFSEMMPELIRDYSIEINYADGGRDVMEVHDNCKRAGRHAIPKAGVKSVKILLKSTYGSKNKQLYAVRLF